MKKILTLLICFTSYFLIGCYPSFSSAREYFNPNASYVSENGGKSFVDLIDGQRIYGDNVHTTGILANIVVVDKVKYRIKEVKGVQIKDRYLLKIGTTLCETVIQGEQLSVYREKVTITDHGMTITNFNYYIKKKGNPLAKMILGFSDIVKALRDCPATEDIKNISKRELKEKLKQNSGFINEYFEKYNQECKK